MHVLSIVILLYRMNVGKSCAGISLKTQILYAIVYITRYTDLLNTYISLYNTGMKLMFIGTSVSAPRRRASGPAGACPPARCAPARAAR